MIQLHFYHEGADLTVSKVPGGYEPPQTRRTTILFAAAAFEKIVPSIEMKKPEYCFSFKTEQFQAQLEQHGRIGLAFDEVKEQNCRLKDHLVNISSKLEVSVIENRIKDEFIVEFLVEKGAAQRQDDKIGQILSTFQEYLKSFSYPSYRLLQDLNEQQQQISSCCKKAEQVRYDRCISLFPTVFDGVEGLRNHKQYK